MKNESNRKLITKILNILMNIFIVTFGIVLLVSIYNLIQVNILGNDKSSFFGYSLFEVQSGSMADTIEKGDWIIVKYSDEIKLNDIVTYKEGNDYITHRVIESYGEVFTTKGDANNTKDEPITSEQIVGKVVKILPAFGIFRATIFNPFVLIALIVTIYIINLTFEKNNNDVESKNGDSLIEKNVEKLISLIQNKYYQLKKNKKQPDNISVKVVENKESSLDKENVDKKENIEKSDIVNENVAEQLDDTLPDVNEDFDKTLYFRNVKVLKEDIDNIKNPKSIQNVEENQVTEEIVATEKEIKQGLELIHKKRKKFKNIIDKAMFIKEEELEEILDVLNEEENLKSNEATIREVLIETYIDGKYYNYCGNVNVEYDGRTINTLVNSAIKTASEDLIKNYKGSDTKFSNKVNKISNMLYLINYLEHPYIKLATIDEKRKFYKDKILKYVTDIFFNPELLEETINKILKIQSKYKGMLKYTIEKLGTNMFILEFNQLSKKNVYGLELKHNVSFSKVYSDYIIDKTYSDGVIAEDKLEVLINLLLIELVKNMYSGEFNKKYILYVPESLYSKVNKLIKIFKLIEDEYAKNNIIILVRYENLIEHKKNILKLMKIGYKFAVDLEDSDLSVMKESVVQMMEYIFIKKDYITKYSKISLSKEIEDKVIIDNIENKIGSYWGE